MMFVVGGRVWGVLFGGSCGNSCPWHALVQQRGPHHQKNRGLRVLRTIRQPTRGGDVASRLVCSRVYYSVTWGRGCCNRFRGIGMVHATVSFGSLGLGPYWFFAHLPITFGIRIPRVIFCGLSKVGLEEGLVSKGGCQ